MFDEEKHSIVVMTKPITMDFTENNDPVLLRELIKRINSGECSANIAKTFPRKNGGLPKPVLEKFYEEHKDNKNKFNGILDYFSGTESLVWLVKPSKILNDKEFQQWVEYVAKDVIGETNPHSAVRGSYRRYCSEIVPGYKFTGFCHKGVHYSFDNFGHRSGDKNAAIRERKILGI